MRSMIALDPRRSDHVYNYNRLINGALLRSSPLHAATLGPGRTSRRLPVFLPIIFL